MLLRVSGVVYRAESRCNLAHSSRQGHHLHAPRTRLPQRGAARVDGRPGRVDVVDHARRSRRLPRRDDAAPGISPSSAQGEPALPRQRCHPAQEVVHLDPPGHPERDCQLLRGRPSPSPGPLRVAGNRDEDVGLGPGHDPRDDRGCDRSDPRAPALLPGGDEASSSLVVHDRRPRTREGEPPPGALSAATDRPRPGRPAALAERRHEGDELRCAARAERAARPCARGASLREDEIGQAHDATVGGRCARKRATSCRMRADE